jgi:hypothetical protein
MKTGFDRQMRLKLRLIIAACASLAASPLLAIAPAAAKPQSVDDCEKIQEALAYNACLASFGPERGHDVVTREVPDNADARGSGRKSGRRAAKTRGGVHIPDAISYGKTRGGKSFAVFDVGGKKGSTTKPAGKHRKRR